MLPKLQRALYGALAILAAQTHPSAEAARPTDTEVIARIEESLDGPIGAAASEDLARAISAIVGELPPEDLQYSIDIIGAVAQEADPAATAAAAEAARSAVAEVAAAHPGMVEDWWAELIDDSIAMVAETGPGIPAGPPETDVALPALNLDPAPIPDEPADAPEPELSSEPPETAEDIPPLGGSDLALSTDMLTTLPQDSGEPGPADAAPPRQEAPASDASATEPAEDSAGETVSPNETEEPDEAGAAAETEMAALPLAPAAPTETDLMVSRLLGDLEPEEKETAPEQIAIIGPAPAPSDVPVEIDRMLRSFDGIIELVEFWLQEPIEEATSLELARAVQATILMLPPDNLEAASSVAGAVVAVVAGPDAVQAVTRAAEAGVQVKAARHPQALTQEETDGILTAINTATGNLGAIQPAAGGFAPGPIGPIDDQGIDGGS